MSQEKTPGLYIRKTRVRALAVCMVSVGLIEVMVLALPPHCC